MEYLRHSLSLSFCYFYVQNTFLVLRRFKVSNFGFLCSLTAFCSIFCSNFSLEAFLAKKAIIFENDNLESKRTLKGGWSGPGDIRTMRIIGHFRKYHNTLCLSLQILHKQKSQEKLETMLMQNLGGHTKSIMRFFEVIYSIALPMKALLCERSLIWVFEQTQVQL